MKIGLIGLSNSGKTTIFNALTQATAAVSAYTNSRAEPNLAIVDVGDQRVGRLSKIYQPKKTVYATIELVDFVGVAGGNGNGNAFSNEFMHIIKNMDALAIVLRNFKDDFMGESDPHADWNELFTELLLADLITVENRLERIQTGYQRGVRSTMLQFEERTLRRILNQLNQNQPILKMDFTEDEYKIIKGFQFLTLKPMLIILNSAESNFGQNQHFINAIDKNGHIDVIEFGTEKSIREKGRFRLEGKDYPVQDGNILSFRFNV